MIQTQKKFKYLCIEMIRCKIYLKKSQSDLKEKVKSEVENKLKIKTEVIVDV